jgi:hypothetical protein
MDAEKGWVVRVRVLEEQVKLPAIQLAPNRRQLRIQLTRDFGIPIGQLGELNGVSSSLRQPLQVLELTSEPAEFLGLGLSCGGVIPSARTAQLDL